MEKMEKMEKMLIDLVSIELSSYKLRTDNMVDNTILFWAGICPFNTQAVEYWNNVYKEHTGA